MPFLMVNLDDVGDMQRSMRQLRRRLRRHVARGEDGGCVNEPCQAGEVVDKVPLRQKLMRIRQRGVWRFLVGIAKLDDKPRSLPEFDVALELQPNKMRSTKAIFAKLENRLGLRFLKLAADAGEDKSGNPRYVMPPRIRRMILELAE